MDWNLAFEIFTLVTGVAYVILELWQKKAMWVVGIFTAAAAVVVFASKGLYASVLLNCYYLFASVAGLRFWNEDSKAVEEGIHLRRLTPGTALVSLAVLLAGTALLRLLLVALHDPSSLLDAFIAVLSAIATWWLGRSIPQQWLLWIVADTASSALCFSQGLDWMGGLYVIYTVTAVYGWFHWRRNGTYVTEDNNLTDK